MPVVAKIVHIRKIGGREYRAFVRTWGDLPVGTLNRITGKIMDVENPRGRAYAARNRAAYRSNKPESFREERFHPWTRVHDSAHIDSPHSSK